MVRGHGRNKGHVHDYQFYYEVMKMDKEHLVKITHYRCVGPGKCYKRRKKEIVVEP